MPQQDAIDQFRAQLRGSLTTPADSSYDADRKVHNGMIDRRPALIAKCADVADVIAAVNFAPQQQSARRRFAAADTTPADSESATTAW